MILLEHRARKYFSGKSFVKNLVYNFLEEQMDELVIDFPYINQLDITDTISTAFSYIERNAVSRGKFTNLQKKEIDYMNKREAFLTVLNGKYVDEEEKEIFRSSTQDEINDVLSDEKLSKERYRRKLNSICDKCGDKDICLEVFRTKKN